MIKLGGSLIEHDAKANRLLISFMKTGKLGYLAIDGDQETVFEILGQPDTDAEIDKSTLIWKYGDLEITFYETKIYSLVILFENLSLTIPSRIFKHQIIDLTKESDSSIKSVSSLISKFTPVEKFEKILVDESISFRVEPSLVFEDYQIGFTLESGVRVVFLKNPEQLCAISQALENS